MFPAPSAAILRLAALAGPADNSYMLDRLQHVLDLLNAYEQCILRLEEGLFTIEQEVPPAAALARELTDLLPAHRGFAHERALRLQRSTVGLHETFETLRTTATVLHRSVAKLKRDAEIVLLPAVSEEKRSPETNTSIPAGDYILFRLGSMRFCIFERPAEVLRDVAWRTREGVPEGCEIFPGSESVPLFAGKAELLNLMVFGARDGVRRGIWFEEILPSVIRRENRVQLVPAAGGHPLIKSKFRFRGQDYYVIRLETLRQAAAFTS